MNYKYIIWDWNGTLLNDLDLCIEIVNDMLKGHTGEKLSPEEYKEVFDFPILDYYTRVGFDFTKESFELLCDKFMERYIKEVINTQLQVGGQEILAAIQQKGVGQSILSAAEQGALDQMVEMFNVGKYFDHVSGLGDNLARSKVENGKKILTQIDYNTNEIVFIGDTTHDYEVADHIGVDCILIPQGHHSKRKLKQTKATVVDNLPELLKIL